MSGLLEKLGGGEAGDAGADDDHVFRRRVDAGGREAGSEVPQVLGVAPASGVAVLTGTSGEPCYSMARYRVLQLNSGFTMVPVMLKEREADF